MKILFIHNYYKFRGGEDKVVEDEKTLLEKNGHLVFTYLRYNREIGDYNLKKRVIFLFGSLFSLRTVKELNNIIKRNHPDIVQIFNIYPLISPSVYWAVKKNKIPVVQVINNYRLLCLNGLFLDRKRICEKCKYGNFIPGILKRCNHQSFILSVLYAFATTLIRKYFLNSIPIFIVSNEFVKEKYLESGFNSEKIRVKGNFISRNFKPETIESWDEKYGLYLGRLSKEKGIYTLIKAMRYCPEIKLKIAGDGPEFENIKEYIKDNGLANVELLGYVSQKEAILKNACFLIFPSECYENFPLTILEAYALGVPVIGSNHGAMTSLIRDNETGLHFQVGDERDLAQKIKRLWNSPELRGCMSTNSRKMVEMNFSPDYSYRILLSIYQQLNR